MQTPKGAPSGTPFVISFTQSQFDCTEQTSNVTSGPPTPGCVPSTATLSPSAGGALVEEPSLLLELELDELELDELELDELLAPLADVVGAAALSNTAGEAGRKT